MDYWHLQMCLPEGRGGLKLDSMNMIRNTPSVIGTGEWDDYQCKDFKEKVKIGDIICVKEGHKAVALCKVTSDNFNDQTLENQFLHHNYRKIKLLDVSPPCDKFPQPQGTLSIAKDKNTPSWKFINNWYNLHISMKNYIDLLKSNKNLILTGAPGTGKTYLAREIAKEMGAETEFVQFHPSYDYTDFVEGLRPVKKEDDELGFELKDGTFKRFCKKALKALPSEKKFVIIIDEINRAEISKVFGELFFSIDPGYRGTKGKVKTQYANLQDDDDDFADGFYVPENVYIIGTMNDIDRSVESMDFAMRRRFAWQEIKSEDRISMWDGEIDDWKDEAKKRMNSLNKAMEGDEIQGLSSDHHIGPAYFLKLKEYAGDFGKLWENHLEGVIFEYLRGLPAVDELKKKLKTAYESGWRG